MGRRLVSTLAVAAAIVLFSGEAALAGRLWCAKDPILEFRNGARVQLLVEFDETHAARVTGPVEFTIVVPRNAGPIDVAFPASDGIEKVTVSYTGADWDGSGRFSVRATALVPATARFETVTNVRGNVQKQSSVRGSSNQLTRVGAAVDPTQWSPLLGDTTIVSRVTVTGTATVYGP